MIWIYILMPVFILSGIAIYYDKKYGSTPDESKLSDRLEEYPPPNNNSYGP